MSLLIREESWLDCWFSGIDIQELVDWIACISSDFFRTEYLMLLGIGSHVGACRRRLEYFCLKKTNPETCVLFLVEFAQGWSLALVESSPSEEELFARTHDSCWKINEQAQGRHPCGWAKDIPLSVGETHSHNFHDGVSGGSWVSDVCSELVTVKIFEKRDAFDMETSLGWQRSGVDCVDWGGDWRKSCHLDNIKNLTNKFRIWNWQVLMVTTLWYEMKLDNKCT